MKAFDIDVGFGVIQPQIPSISKPHPMDILRFQAAEFPRSLEVPRDISGVGI